MIVAGVRSRLTRDDVALVLSLLAPHGGEARERGEDMLRDRAHASTAATTRSVAERDVS